MRLVKPEIAAAWKAYGGQEAPSLVADGAARDAFLAETGNLRPQVVAHEIEFMFAIALSGMAGKFRGRRGKDQPSTAGINGGKPKHVPEKSAVGLGVARVDDGMHACNHGHLHRCGSVGRFSCRRIPGTRTHCFSQKMTVAVMQMPCLTGSKCGSLYGGKTHRSEHCGGTCPGCQGFLCRRSRIESGH